MKYPITSMTEALDFLYGFINYERKTGVPYTGEHYNLNRFRTFLTHLGNPQQALKTVHIAGTKGKGSTSAMIAALLTVHGARTGLFTSPHLVSVRERFRIDGCAISNARFIDLVSRLAAAVSESDQQLATGYRTTFELMTALAFLFFRDRDPDWSVFEVGMGGRLDCTNVISPETCVITPVSRDHTESLGISIKTIAREKAGIMKPGVPVVTGARMPAVLRELRIRAEAAGCPFYRRSDLVVYRIEKMTPFYTVFSVRYRRRWIRDIRLNLSGRIQIDNAALALAALAVLEDAGQITLTDQGIRNAFRRLRWPGRFAVLNPGTRETSPFTGHLITDGAHNPSALNRLAGQIRRLFPDTPVNVIFAAPANKDVVGMLKAIAPVADRLVITEYHNARSMKVADLVPLARRFHAKVSSADSLDTALTIASEKSKEYHHLLVTGSLYLAGELYELTGNSSAVIDLGFGIPK